MVYSPHSYFSNDEVRRNVDMEDRVRHLEYVREFFGQVEFSDMVNATPARITDYVYYRNGEFADTTNGLSYNVNPSSTPEVSPDNEYLKKYHGCLDCWKFSMLFGGSYEAVFGNNPEKRNIQTEDDFEVVKGEFVAHFNEKHKDLFPIRKAKVAKAYKVKPKPEPTPFGTSELIPNTNNIVMFDLMEIDVDRLREFYDGMAVVSGRQSGRWSRFINSLRRD